MNVTPSPPPPNALLMDECANGATGTCIGDNILVGTHIHTCRHIDDHYQIRLT